MATNTTAQLIAGDEADQSLAASGALWPKVAAAFLGYVILCSFLRFRRINAALDRFGYRTRESMSKMTVQEAQEILLNVLYTDFTFFYETSLQVALFRTYAVENVGHVLYSVSDLANDHIPKRYEDTSIIYTWAVARTNYLHSPYIKSGKIRNKDLLYVLYASMAEPVRFLNLYEWRTLTQMEVCALGTLWKYVGDLMEIDYKAELGHNQWVDGIAFMEDVGAWASKYEDKYLFPTKQSEVVGAYSLDLLLTSYPESARSLGHTAVMVLLGNRLRHAFGFSEPGIFATIWVHLALAARIGFMRFLALPRWQAPQRLSPPDEKTGRIEHYRYLKEPWYVPPSFWARWNPEALAQRAFNLLVPGDSSKDWRSDGFLFEDLGPMKKMGQGLDETLAMQMRAKSMATSESPF